ncbi:MAG: hypothetical protein JSW23_00350 [Planctomycetota bacterium]|nr:MAG: hypothetical protein JSW23_00350 [Planctomycetota bacterium]
MLTLIKREIEDHIAYLIGAGVFSAVFVGILISLVYGRSPNEPRIFVTGLTIPLVAMCMAGFCAMGAAQMYTDKTRKISALLATLATTRAKILAARIIVGVLVILTGLAPLIITAVILLRLFGPEVPMYGGMIAELSIAAFLMGFACYCIGLQTGWSPSKVAPTLGGLALSCVLVGLFVVKGFGLHTAIILVLFIAASLVNVWHKFMSTSL